MDNRKESSLAHTNPLPLRQAVHPSCTWSRCWPCPWRKPLPFRSFLCLSSHPTTRVTSLKSQICRTVSIKSVHNTHGKANLTGVGPLMSSGPTCLVETKPEKIAHTLVFFSLRPPWYRWGMEMSHPQLRSEATQVNVHSGGDGGSERGIWTDRMGLPWPEWNWGLEKIQMFGEDKH